MGFKISRTGRQLLKVTLHSRFTQRDLLRVNLTTIFVCNTTLFRSFPATSQRRSPQGVQQDHFRTLSRHRVYLSPTAVDRRRQMETIPGYYLEKGWVSGKVEAGGGPAAFFFFELSEKHSVRGRASDPASKYNTCKMRVDRKRSSDYTGRPDRL